MQLQKHKIYNVAIDVLRTLAIVAVVGIHTTTRVLEAASFNLQAYSFTLFLNQAFRFAVPLFFLISGFVLELNYPFHASYTTYLKKRLSRILLPYACWSIVYFFFVYPQSIGNLLNALLTGNASYQLYFVPTLLIFYLLFPLLHKYFYVVSNRFVLLGLFILQIFLLYQDYFGKPKDTFYPFHIALLNFFVFILGAIAAHHHQHILTLTKKLKYIILMVTIALMGYIFWEGKSGYEITHNYLAFYSQWRPSVLLYTILLGALLYAVFSHVGEKLLWIRQISRLSFLVFFVHVIVLEIIWTIVGKTLFATVSSNALNQLWFAPLYFLATTLFSFALAFVIHKIPVVRKIAG